jgi:hypothetical protein
MTDFNRVILIGRLTRDPEKSYTTAAMALTKFGLAVNNGFGENKRRRYLLILPLGVKRQSLFQLISQRAKKF